MNERYRLQRQDVNNALLALYGGDPFDAVLQRAEAHRERHGPECGLYPAGPLVMRLAATLVAAIRPRRVLDLGAGIGYSSLWLAHACPDGGQVEAIDRFPEHIALARELAGGFPFGDRITFLVGEVSDVLERLTAPYDFIHDDAWFAARPAHLDRAIALLRPGGTLTMPNWFLLEDAITGEPRRDWSKFAGPEWREHTLAYAHELSRRADLFLSWCVSPPLLIAVKTDRACQEQ